MRNNVPKFYDRDGVPYCDWRGQSHLILEVEGERFLVPVALWEQNGRFRDRIVSTLATVVKLFKEAIDRGVPFEDARYILPEGSISRLEFEGVFGDYPAPHST